MENQKGLKHCFLGRPVKGIGEGTIHFLGAWILPSVHVHYSCSAYVQFAA